MRRVILLGTKGGPAIRTGGPSPTSSVLVAGNRHYIVDCGLGVTRGLVEAGFHLSRIQTILITHFHSDHVLELGPLLHTAWTAGLNHKVDVHGPPGLKNLLRHFFETHRFDIETRICDEGRPDLRELVAPHEFTEGHVFDDGTMSVSALRTDHPPVFDSFAFRFDDQDRSRGPGSVVFSGDTAPLVALAQFASAADLLIHEAMYEPGVDALVARVANGSRLKAHLLASHSLAEDVGTIATKAGVRHLVLNHLIPADDPAVTHAHWEAAVRATWTGRLTIPFDGQSVDF